MTPQEAFKLGFIEKCAEKGLSEDEILFRAQLLKMAAIDKQAKGGSLIGGALSAGGNISKGLVGLIGPLLMGLPIVGGGLGGYAASKMFKGVSSKNPIVDEITRREEIAEYNRALKRLKSKLEQKQGRV